jgi:predicted DNA-binding transcriptional regulator YafY
MSEPRVAWVESAAARRFERWLTLIPYCAREGEGLSLEQLAELFDDAPESVLADAQALVEREFYLPGGFADSLKILIDAERLAIDSPDHFRRPVRFSPLEALAVQLGLQAVLEETQDAEEEGVKAALAELTAALEVAGDAPDAGSAAGAEHEIDSLAFGSGLSGVALDVLAEVRRGLRERRVVELEYFKPYDPVDPATRRVEPWALVAVHGMWYFLGRDLGVGEARVFRLDRIVAAHATDEVATIPGNLNVEDYIDPQRVFRESEDDLEVTVRYAPRIARWIQERCGEPTEGQPDGSVVVRHRCKSPWWAVACVLNYGLEAEIGRPREVRAILKRAVKGVADLPLE